MYSIPNFWGTKKLSAAGGASNLGSAVATSMNLTNSSEPIGAESGAAYKSEPADMMYYHTPTSDSINQTTDGFLSSLLNDEDLHLMDMAMNDGMYKIFIIIIKLCAKLLNYEATMFL